MPSHFGISKNLRPNIIYGVLGSLTLVLLALAYGFIQLTRYSEPFPVEWANQAGSVWLRFDNSTTYSGRIIFVNHSSFGKRMIDEYQNLNRLMYPTAVQEFHPLYSAFSADQQSMSAYKYLDYFAVAKLKAQHLHNLLFSESAPGAAKNTEASPDAYLQPLFTRGLYKQPDNTLVDRLRLLTQKAEPGSYIRMSVFLFFYSNENEPLLVDLLAAAERGVNVQLLIDLPEADNPERRGIGYTFQTSFAKRLEIVARGHSDSWLKNHTPVSWDSKNHTKIFLFSDTAGFKNWVIITSENLTDSEREKYQAGLVMRDKYSYNAFDKYWQQILDGAYKDLWSASNGKNLTHYFFPQTAHQDVIYHQLDRICVTPQTAEKSSLRISMARWNFERFPLAMKLVDLAEKGVHIKIITRNNPQIVDTIILKALDHRPNITLHTADVDKLNIHSKYILYEGCYGELKSERPETPKKILWVGSHNFTGMAMRNNYETWTDVRDDGIFREFSENFTELESLVPVDPNSENIN